MSKMDCAEARKPKFSLAEPPPLRRPALPQKSVALYVNRFHDGDVSEAYLSSTGVYSRKTRAALKHRESKAHQEQVLALTKAHLNYYQLFCDPSGYRRLYAMNHRTGELVFDQYFLREPQRLTEMAKALSLIHGEAKLPQGMIICKAVPNWFSHFEYYVKNATGRDKFEEWRTNKDKRLSSLQKIALRSQNGEMV
ncbi:hypothetical protein Pmar_PMAR016457 [Perkinsus marinus ATCC 50983]|uniref:Uncharacterized protein n=1 Tax=Perkinsus marinus (strain ATCC 50983 / TXsc) TaxID=423536 RepID=C5L1B8_PERM5|nr:hypothetical protein Pmar_PMAR016457 [Perkinsus marinus ATCC 50983]EER09525.1 hypothetical protein Pmar_PMAR016457 [Perkinsus marinus ATCC 50983]|eukprot:XP_002777709.1 hypothetical protein Pmar_PMAR016457 [Perkinsus marinus ATCC 50983]